MKNFKKYSIGVRCLFLWVFFMPFSFIPLPGLGSVFRYLAIMIVLYYFFNGGTITLKRSIDFLPLAIYVVYYSFSLTWSKNLIFAIPVILGFIQVLVLAFLLSNKSLSTKDIELIEFGWISIAVFLSIFFLAGSGRVINWGGRSTLFLFGAYTDPNEFAGVYIVPASLMMFRMFSGSFYSRFIYFLLITNSIYIVLQTGSRGALISLVISLFFVIQQSITFSIKNTLKMTMIILIFLYMITNFVIPTIPISVIERLSFSSILADGGSERVTIWKDAIYYFLNDSTFNQTLGLGLFGSSIFRGTMHNQFLQNLIDGGFIGLLFYLLLIISSSRKIYKDFRNFFPGLIGLLFLSLTLTMTASYKPFWTIIMFGLMKRRVVKHENANARVISSVN